MSNAVSDSVGDYTLRDRSVENKSVPVKYDPYDMSVAWVYAGNRWHQCRSQHRDILRGRSEVDIRLAAQEIRQRKRVANKARFTVTADMIAAYFAEQRRKEEELLAMRQRESQKARELLMRAVPQQTSQTGELSEDSPKELEPREIKELNTYSETGGH